jgi:ubiquitin carboxyl-terminal hydrolase 1
LEVSQVPAPPPQDPNFIAKDFEGVMVLKTMCLECEAATERKETFSDICLPIMNQNPENSKFKKI